MSSVPNSEQKNQLEEIMKSFVQEFLQEKIELIMREEIRNFLKEQDEKNYRNGYYTRSLDTLFGQIEDLNVPRDRNGDFQTQLIEPYQKRDCWLEEAIIRMYQKGMSTRDVAKFIETLLGDSYSPSTVSNITEVALEDIQEFQNRPLKKRYSVLYLDGMNIKLRRDSVENESVYIACGVDEEGYREILGFYVGGRENALGWQELLNDLHSRGVQEVLLGVFDGLPGLADAFKKVFPKADVQQCVIHQVRNTLNAVRKKDQYEVAEDLKPIYKSFSKEEAHHHFEKFKEKWGSRYPRVVDSWEKNLPNLLTFLDYPSDIRAVIYTTNWIERTIKEIRKRLKTMNSLTSPKAAEKVIFFAIQDINVRWANKKLRGFKQCQHKLQEMFELRYDC
ncbi:IS256 family transposase [Natranaerobius thermophilus]|uniref:Mutator family transposase n=2 Tax=Natranaerobius thermophilus (strain ATCC BAA-1301 / DSM 18059 / JW/NM-WN-LF) TaxID=457570 RepID=B2A8L7_NATTJ|nr:IS256 family transposase [Natranaerobius thermophilus]ACB85901.1 transposase mutator type [Natranaerobius thermophilus JW/NM-WN-LF]